MIGIVNFQNRPVSPVIISLCSGQKTHPQFLLMLSCNNILASIVGPCVQEVNHSLLFIMVDVIICCRNSEAENGERCCTEKANIPMYMTSLM